MEPQGRADVGPLAGGAQIEFEPFVNGLFELFGVFPFKLLDKVFQLFPVVPEQIQQREFQVSFRDTDVYLDPVAGVVRSHLSAAPVAYEMVHSRLSGSGSRLIPIIAGAPRSCPESAR